MYKGTQPIFLQAPQPLPIHRQETPYSNEEARHRSKGMPQIISTKNSMKNSPKQNTLVSMPSNSITRKNNLNTQPTNPIILHSNAATKLPNSIHSQSNHITRPTNPIPRPTKPIDQTPTRIIWPPSSLSKSSQETARPQPSASITPTRCHHTICKIHHHMDTLKMMPTDTLPFPNIRRLMARQKFILYPRPVYEHNFPSFDLNVDATNYLT